MKTSASRNIFQIIMLIMLVCGSAGILWYFLKPAKVDIVSNQNMNLFLENAIVDVQQDLKSEITKPDIASRLAWFKSNTSLYQSARRNKDAHIKEESQKLKQLIVKAQTKSFPNMRQAYVTSKHDVLKDQHIEVRLEGSQKDILVISGGMFEPKKNQQAFLKDIEPVVRDLRFQEVVYKFSGSNGDEEHYSIDAKKDDEV